MNILKCFDNITDFYHQINYDLKIVVRICTCYYRLLEVLQIHYKLFLKMLLSFMRTKHIDIILLNMFNV